MSTPTTQNHTGYKISRIRELRGMKQETLAVELGVTQQTVSNIEKSASVEDDILEQVAKILGVTPEAIENFSEEAVFNFFSTFNDHSTNNGAIHASNCTFNLIDKFLESLEEIKKLHEDNKELYERLLAAEKEKVIFLQQLLKEKK